MILNLELKIDSISNNFDGGKIASRVNFKMRIVRKT